VYSQVRAISLAITTLRRISEHACRECRHTSKPFHRNPHNGITPDRSRWPDRKWIGVHPQVQQFLVNGW
jgi:hypothetical protein